MTSRSPLPVRFPMNKFYDLFKTGDILELKKHFIDVEVDHVRSSDHAASGWLLQDTVRVFHTVRTAVGHPLHINSGYRTEEYQGFLLSRGLRVAQTSPHTFGAALDIEVPNGYTQESFAKLILKLTANHVRVGWKQYAGQNFVHMDMAFLLQPNPVPSAYIAGVTW